MKIKINCNRIIPLLTACALISSFSIPQAVAGKPVKQNQAVKNNKETGPVGIGALKIGMSRDEVETIGADEPVALISPLRAMPVDKNFPSTEADRYVADLRTPFTTGAEIPVKLYFTDGILTFISIQIDGKETAIKRMAEQISSRYGSGEFKDEMKEEQCIYRNGSNFKIKSGSAVTEWSQVDKSGRKVTAVFRASLFDMCPSSLRYAMPKAEWESLSFEYRAPAAQPAPATIF